MSSLTVLNVGPSVTLQDAGWHGSLALGLSQGGVVDTCAYAHAAALLGTAPGAVLEMAGFGGTFRADAPVRFALTGAPMRASLDGVRLEWNAVYTTMPGQVLDIGSAEYGVYGFLAFGGGIAHEPVLGSRSTHRAAGLGCVFVEGDTIRVMADPMPQRSGLKLPKISVNKSHVRLVPTAQTSLFPEQAFDLLTSTEFVRAPRGNRQGVGLESAHDFSLLEGQSMTSETVIPGDIQIPGDGTPVVLLADCQTTGGYPRIASVLPCDIPRIAQAGPGDKLRFTMLTLQQGLDAERNAQKSLAALSAKCVPMLRDPHDIQDLLGYQLISGVTGGTDEQGT